MSRLVVTMERVDDPPEPQAFDTLEDAIEYARAWFVARYGEEQTEALVHDLNEERAFYWGRFSRILIEVEK